MKSETDFKYVIKRGNLYSADEDDGECLTESLAKAFFYNTRRAAENMILPNKGEIIVPVEITYKEEKI